MDNRYSGRRARCFHCEGALIIPEPAADGTAEGIVGLIDAPPEPDELRADPPQFMKPEDTGMFPVRKVKPKRPTGNRASDRRA